MCVGWESTHSLSLYLSVCSSVFSLKAILILNILRVSFNVKTLRMCMHCIEFFTVTFSAFCCKFCYLRLRRDELFDSMHSATVIFHLQRMMQNICHNICKRSRKKHGEQLVAFSHVKLYAASSSSGSTFYLLLESRTKKTPKATNIFHGKYGTVC